VGSGVLLGATFLAAVMADAEQLLFRRCGPWDWVWTFGLVGASSLLMDNVRLEDRVAVQGTADLLMSLCGGIAGFGSGFVRAAIGFHLLAAVAMLAAGGLFIVTHTANKLRSLTAAPVPAL
jgi:hypothetical protein